MKTSNDTKMLPITYLIHFRWFCIERVLASGRKILSFVNPDQTLAFRSKVAVYEFLKFLGIHSEQDLENWANTLSIRGRMTTE